MTQRPGPRGLTDDALSAMLAAQQFGTLATNKRSGHPHLTTMLYSWDAEARLVRFSTTADRVKVAQLRRDPRAALHVPGGDVWSFAVAEGEAEVSEPTVAPGDAIGRELLAIVPESGKPSDEEAFFERGLHATSVPAGRSASPARPGLPTVRQPRPRGWPKAVERLVTGL